MKNLENLTINDYISIIRRRIGYVVVTTVLISAGVVAFVWRLPKVYKSDTTILIQSRLLPEDYIRSLDRQTSTDKIDFVRQQLQSRTFLEQIVHEFNLTTRPGREGVEVASAMVKGNYEISVLTATTFRLGFFSPDPNLAQAITKRLAEKVIQLNDSFRKEKTQDADRFLGDQLKQAGDELTQAEERLAQYRNQGIAGEVVTADGLRDLQSQLAKLDTSLEDLNSQRKSLERRVDEQRQLQLVMRSSAPRTETAAPVAAAPATPAAPTPAEQELAKKRTELASLQSRYTTSHPDVVRLQSEVKELEGQVRQQAAAAAAAAAAKAASTPAAPVETKAATPALPDLGGVDLFAAEVNQEIEQVGRNIAKTEQARRTLLGRIAAYQERLNPSPAGAEQLGSLTRAYDAAKQRYNYLSDKRLNAEMAARVDESESNEMFKVVDPAYLPLKPVRPNRRLLAMLGSLAGLVVGLGVAFLRDYLDPTLHNEEDAVSELKLPVLASIPNIPATPKDKDERRHSVRLMAVQPVREVPGNYSIKNADAKIRDVLLSPLSVAGEHYRLLQSILTLMQKERQMKSLIISSAVPGEGKTFTSCCLAGTLAQEPGKKVLLIDADLRRSNATNTLGLKNIKFANTFGALLRGEADIETSPIQFTDSNLYFLPSGNLVSNPLETLSSPQLERVLRHFSQIFDWVIVDSPPVMAVADANLMLPLCDAMLMVVHSGKTPVKLVKDSIQRVGRDRIYGILLNRTKVIQSSYYYGYGGYYATPAQPPTRFLGTKRTDAE